jgi:uncharacterized RDD family membrane protein YckC
MYWYWVENNAQQGPVGDAELQAMIDSGRIGPDTLVWRDGFANWIPWREAAARPTPPPPAAPPPAAPLPADAETCTQCHRVFPKDDLMRFENERVCADCKPLYVQRLKEGVQPSTQLAYAGFWIRALASLIDFGINYLFGLGVTMLAGKAGVARASTFSAWNAATCGLQLFLALAGMAYDVLFVGALGATPGKLALKLRIVRPDGGRISYGRAFGRYFAKIVSYIILGIGFIMAAFDDEKRALHDRICDTRVIRA